LGVSDATRVNGLGHVAVPGRGTDFLRANWTVFKRLTKMVVPGVFCATEAA
jgi:hypothetical protein